MSEKSPKEAPVELMAAAIHGASSVEEHTEIIQEGLNDLVEDLELSNVSADTISELQKLAAKFAGSVTYEKVQATRLALIGISSDENFVGAADRLLVKSLANQIASIGILEGKLDPQKDSG